MCLSFLKSLFNLPLFSALFKLLSLFPLDELSLKCQMASRRLLFVLLFLLLLLPRLSSLFFFFFSFLLLPEELLVLLFVIYIQSTSTIF